MLDDGQEPMGTQDLDQRDRAIQAKVLTAQQVRPFGGMVDRATERTVATIGEPDLGLFLVLGHLSELEWQGCVHVPCESCRVHEEVCEIGLRQVQMQRAGNKQKVERQRQRK